MTLEQVIKANKNRARERAELTKKTRLEQQKRLKEEKTVSFILGFSVASLIFMIILIGIYNDKQLEKCIKKHQDRIYCERVL